MIFRASFHSAPKPLEISLARCCGGWGGHPTPLPPRLGRGPTCPTRAEYLTFFFKCDLGVCMEFHVVPFRESSGTLQPTPRSLPSVHCLPPGSLGLTACQAAQLQALPGGGYVPRCTAAGGWTPRQCHGGTGFCWCVGPNGTEIGGTRVFGQALQCQGVPRSASFPFSVGVCRRGGGRNERNSLPKKQMKRKF